MAIMTFNQENETWEDRDAMTYNADSESWESAVIRSFNQDSEAWEDATGGDASQILNFIKKVDIGDDIDITSTQETIINSFKASSKDYYANANNIDNSKLPYYVVKMKKYDLKMYIYEVSRTTGDARQIFQYDMYSGGSIGVASFTVSSNCGNVRVYKGNDTKLVLYMSIHTPYHDTRLGDLKVFRILIDRESYRTFSISNVYSKNVTQQGSVYLRDLGPDKFVIYDQIALKTSDTNSFSHIIFTIDSGGNETPVLYSHIGAYADLGSYVSTSYESRNSDENYLTFEQYADATNNVYLYILNPDTGAFYKKPLPVNIDHYMHTAIGRFDDRFYIAFSSRYAGNSIKIYYTTNRNQPLYSDLSLTLLKETEAVYLEYNAIRSSSPRILSDNLFMIGLYCVNTLTNSVTSLYNNLYNLGLYSNTDGNYQHITSFVGYDGEIYLYVCHTDNRYNGIVKLTISNNTVIDVSLIYKHNKPVVNANMFMLCGCMYGIITNGYNIILLDNNMNVYNYNELNGYIVRTNSSSKYFQSLVNNAYTHNVIQVNSSFYPDDGILDNALYFIKDAQKLIMLLLKLKPKS